MTEILVNALLKPGVLEPGDNVELVETHISWVLLTDRHAYKIKKPVNLGFVDFSTLEKRKFYCEEELRLNRKLAPALYLEVIGITGTQESPVIGGTEPGFEYAVKMKRFSKDNELGQVIKSETGLYDAFRQLATTLAEFHQDTGKGEADTNHGAYSVLEERCLDNFRSIDHLITDPITKKRLDKLEQWTRDSLARNRVAFRQRKKSGKICECHGDLHLGNLVLLDGRIIPFDCLEFNESMRWIDNASEIAFLFMDLAAHFRTDLAWIFLNEYLDASGDYGLIQVFQHYLVYRAMVRLKVACLSTSGDESESPVPDYLQVAENFAYGQQPTRLIITHGLSGCGKTWLTSKILEAAGAIRLRTDVVRKQGLHAAPFQAPDDEAITDLYSADKRSEIYEKTAKLAEAVVEAGYPVIVDATFLSKSDRDRFRCLADTLDVEFKILDIEATYCTLVNRIRNRAKYQKDASDADVDVLNLQIKSRIPLQADEIKYRVGIDSCITLDRSRLEKLITDLGLEPVRIGVM